MGDGHLEAEMQRTDGTARAMCMQQRRAEAEGFGGCGLESWWLRLRARIAGLVEGKVPNRASQSRRRQGTTRGRLSTIFSRGML
jgi:hypothetical protein